MHQAIRGVGALVCLLLTACAGAGDDAGAPPFGGSGGQGGFGAFGGGFGGTSGSGGGSPGNQDGGVPELPPEMELRADFELPRAGERFVYAANPLGDTVAVIDATTLRISTVEAGDQPTFLQTLAGTDNAIVLNVGSNDATVIRASETGITRATVPVVPGANAISVARDGKHAVVYYDSAYTQTGSNSGSFQDVSVITIDDDGDTSVSLTVGFRPVAVFHQADSTRAFVVTEDGVSILDYASIDANGAGIAPTIPIGAQNALDVSITDDGNYALARSENSAALRLVNLNTRALTTLELTDALLPVDDDTDAGVPDAGDVEAPSAPLVVTDLDLAPGGQLAYGVVRDRGVVLALPIPAAFTDPTSIRAISVPNQVIGSITIADDGSRALLYTTAFDPAEAVTLIDLGDFDAPPITIPLRKAVKAVAIAPDAQTALVVHKKAEGDPRLPGLDPDLSIDRSYGYSVVSFDSALGYPAKLQVTDTEVGPFTIVPDGRFLFLLFNSDNARLVQRVNLRSFLVDSVPLGSRPVSIGAVAQSHKVFVSQEHPDGRITFIDWLATSIADATESVTGFELNSRIRE